MRIALVAFICAALAVSPLAAQVPRPAGDFSVNLPGGKELPLKSLRGKTVLLAFVYTTCPHCQSLTPELAKVQKEFASKGVQVVECAFNDGVNEQLATAFAQQYGAAFPVGWKDRASVLTFLQMSLMSPLYVPHLTFIDSHGTIKLDVPGENQFMQNAPANIRAELTKLVAATTPASTAARKKK